ncbi:MAG: DUF6377 domain-containing protein [Alloprevotella sp.]|nr:DUF6377 domain-containing protein [Bacteroidales bacterium]MDY3942831.1 DUF6377 domain-containing protein [Alloprevotella sp.]
MPLRSLLIAGLFSLLQALLAQSASSAPITLLPETQEALRALNVAIEKKNAVRQSHERGIAVVKRDAKRLQGYARIEKLKALISHYSHVQTDSAWHYLELLRQQPEVAKDVQLQNYLAIATAEVLAVKGLFYDAQSALTHIQRHALTEEQRRYYYHTARSLYGWMAEYTDVPRIAKRWEHLTQLYRDSIIMAEPLGVGRDIVRADKALTEKQFEVAQSLLDSLKSKQSSTEQVYVYNLLATLCRQTGKQEKAIYYLARTARLDLERGVTEYEALTHLAQALYEQGDIERAYMYLRCSLEDAAYCGTSLRTLESSNMFSIIDRAYAAHEQQKKHIQWVFTSVVGLLAVVLIFALFYLRNRVRQLRIARHNLSETMVALQKVNNQLSATMQSLQETNVQLQETNDTLQLTGRMKDEYITRYLERCRAYLDQMQEYRFSISKMLKSKDYVALAAKLKADSRMTDEQASFYADFDEAFLHLFPHFINRFNALLRPDSQIEPKRPGSLTTELRIFALIRLGVQDTNTIAHFLNNSLATVYNYRSRIRNMSIVGKDDFEAEVMKI